MERQITLQAIIWMENTEEPLKRLFHQQFSKMVAVISKTYGLHHIEIAEDIVSDTFLLAIEDWARKGVPQNPAGWLYLVAKRKTLHYFKRNQLFENKLAPEIKREAELASNQLPDLNFSDKNIQDSQLKMLFTICNPAIASEAQIGLALRVLCGFGIEEIADAFLTTKETINKRLVRARSKLRNENLQMDLPGPQELTSRLANVLHIIYLLFNEGYFSKWHNQLLRTECCMEALRLGRLLIDYPPTDLPTTNALMALMCFHGSRLNARMHSPDAFVLYDQQDEKRWDQSLIRQGAEFLSHAAKGPEISSYHLEARIAFWHCNKSTSRIKWLEILELYNLLMTLNHSPMVALNRLYALYKVQGVAVALNEAKALPHMNNLFYHILLGELNSQEHPMDSRWHFEQAFQLATTRTEQDHIQRKMDLLSQK